MSSLRPATCRVVKQTVLLRGVGACGVSNCKIAKKKKEPNQIHHERFTLAAFIILGVLIAFSNYHTELRVSTSRQHSTQANSGSPLSL